MVFRRYTLVYRSYIGGRLGLYKGYIGVIEG